MLSFEDIPDDLVPLTAHFKEILNVPTEKQVKCIYLDIQKQNS